MARRQTSDFADQEERRVKGILSRASRRKSEAGVEEVLTQRELISQLTDGIERKKVSQPSEPESSDSSDDEFDESELRALDAAVSAGLAATFVVKKPSSLPARRRKLLSSFDCGADPSPYLKDSVVATSAIAAQHGKKGAGRDAATLAESSSLYQVAQHKAAPAVKKGVTSGKDWFDLQATEMTEELKQDLRAVRMRSALDPKRFYKALDRPSKFVQIGTVVEGRDEFFTARLTKKERRSNLVEELMADVKARQYTKRKYNDIQKEKKNKRHFGPKKRTKLSSRVDKKGKQD